MEDEVVDENVQSLVDKAAAEGIDMEDGSPIVQVKPADQKDDEQQPETDSSTVDQQEPSTEDAKDTSAEEETHKDTPLHEHPRFREVTRQNREFKDKLKEAEQRERDFQERLARLEERTAQTNQPQLTPEQLQAKDQLLETLGLKGIDQVVNQLKAQNEQLTKAQVDRAFDEEESRLSSRIDELGLAKDEAAKQDIFDQLDDHIKSNRTLSRLQGEPGVYELAFSNLYLNKFKEFGERAANQKEIERREKAKGSKLEGSSKTVSTSPASLKTTNDLAKKLQEIGLENIDFDR